ncbi:hypothetical protein BC332_12865 [Capsicum chinense]|nr:hypothetical protein BC332_12865 [Capsicum chinense]
MAARPFSVPVKNWAEIFMSLFTEEQLELLHKTFHSQLQSSKPNPSIPTCSFTQSGDDLSEMENLKKNLASEFEIKDFGQLKYFLGMGVASSKEGIMVSQSRLNILEYAGKSVIGKMNKLGERMNCLLQGIREHVSLSLNLTEMVKGKLNLGAKLLKVGGLEKIFKQKFSVKDDEKLLKVSQCYLSTTAGPIAGLLYISTDKIAFCREIEINKAESCLESAIRFHSALLSFHL